MLSIATKAIKVDLNTILLFILFPLSMFKNYLQRCLKVTLTVKNCIKLTLMKDHVNKDFLKFNVARISYLLASGIGIW